MLRTSDARVSTRWVTGTADSSSRRIACSRRMAPSCSAAKPATSTSSPNPSVLLPAAASFTAPVASVSRKPSSSVLTTPRRRTRCPDRGAPPTRACTVKNGMSAAVGAGRTMTISRVEETSSRDLPVRPEASWLVTRTPCIVTAGVEVLRRIGPPDLAHAGVEILAVDAHGQGEASTRVHRRMADDAGRLDEPVLVPPRGDVIGRDPDRRRRGSGRDDAQLLAQHDRRGAAHGGAARQLDDVADAHQRIEAEAIDAHAARRILDPGLIEGGIGEGDGARQLDVHGGRQRRRKVPDLPDRGDGLGWRRRDEAAAAGHAERQCRDETGRPYMSVQPAGTALHAYSIGRRRTASIPGRRLDSARAGLRTAVQARHVCA